jgi:hypothetical protein
MHKTLLAALIGASVFALPAFAQVHLGGGGHAGGSLTARTGGALPGAAGTPGQLSAQTRSSLDRLDRQSHRTARDADARTRATLDRRATVEAAPSVDGSAHAQAGDTQAHAHADARANARVDAGAAADHAADTSRGVGQQVSSEVHSAIGSADRTADSVGDTARQSATESSVGADAKVRARADAHGH